VLQPCDVLSRRVKGEGRLLVVRVASWPREGEIAVTEARAKVRRMDG